MEHLGDESDRRSLGGVVGGELQLEFEKAAIPGCLLRSFHEGSPIKQVALLWGSVDTLVLLLA